MILDLDAIESMRQKPRRETARPAFVCYRCREKCIGRRDLAEHERDHDRREWQDFATLSQEKANFPA